MKQWMRGLLPVVLLAGVLGVFFAFGPLGVFWAAFPPVEELTIERIELPEPNSMILHVVNGGPDPVTVAQILVDDALWQFRTEPEEKTISRLGHMKIYVPYPWVEGEMHEVAILTSTGLTFAKEIEVATQSPRTNWSYFWTFSMLGIYAGVIPVFLGLLWYPFFARFVPSLALFFSEPDGGIAVFSGGRYF